MKAAGRSSTPAIWIASILTAGTLAALAGCMKPAVGPVKGPPSESREIKVTAVFPRRERITRTITLTASLEAFEQVALYAKVSGYLKSIKVDIGDRVAKGQVLAVLEVPEMKHQVVEASGVLNEREAALERARAEAELRRVIFVRSRGLRKKDAITEQDLDEARARYTKAKADVSLAKSRLKSSRARLGELKAMMAYARLRAPFDSIVTRRFVDPGALVQAATAGDDIRPIVTLARTDVMRVFVDVPEPDTPLVRKGQHAVLELSATLHEKFSGKVTRFSDALDPATRTMRTEVDLPNPDGRLKPGMFGRLTLVMVDRQHALTVPLNAVRATTSGPTVYLQKDGYARRHSVRVGVAARDRIEVLSGLGDRAAVLVPASVLTDGVAVSVEPADGSTGKAVE